MSTFTLVIARKSLCLLLTGSCWHWDFDTVLAVNPFAIFKLKLSYANVHFSFFFFFVIWFRASTRVRWVAHVISEFLLEWIIVDPRGLFYHDVFPFGLFLGQV
jgi:hypothetical protein